VGAGDAVPKMDDVAIALDYTSSQQLDSERAQSIDSVESRRAASLAAIATGNGGGDTPGGGPIELELIGAYHGGRLRVVYDGGAVMRDVLEIDSSPLVGHIERGAVMRASERRVNSCNIARYAITHVVDGARVKGWISEVRS
jgi:hypothetical protein